MMYWFSNLRSGGRGGHDGSLFGSMGRYATHALVAIAAILILLGVFVLVFPLALAIVVAVIFFWAAAMCLGFAWRLFRASRPRGQMQRHVDVEVIDPHDRP